MDLFCFVTVYHPHQLSPNPVTKELGADRSCKLLVCANYNCPLQPIMPFSVRNERMGTASLMPARENAAL